MNLKFNMNFKIVSLIVVFGIILIQGVSSENITNAGINEDNSTVNEAAVNETLNETEKSDKKEITISSVEMTIDDKGLVHLKETLIIPTVDNKGEILVPEDIVVPGDAKNSLSIFYELGTKKLDFKQEGMGDKKLITISFPPQAKPNESQVITVEYRTYQFTSTSAGVGTLKFSSLPTTPDITLIKIKFHESLKIIPQTIPDSTISGNELEIKPTISVFNLTYRYYLPMPQPPEDNESEDENPPVITIKGPENNATFTPGNITFMYLVEDNSGIKNCTLIINAEVKKVDDAITVKDNEFITNLSKGRYTWSIQCADNSTNENTAKAASRTLNLMQPESNNAVDELISFILSKYGSISLVLAVVLIIYLIIAYVKRKQKAKPEVKEEELEDLYPETEEKETEKLEGKTREINPSIMKLMDENEKQIINILKDSEETTQANICKITQLPKATLSDIMRKLEERNLIERRVEGRVKWVKLKDWVFE